MISLEARQAFSPMKRAYVRGIVAEMHVDGQPRILTHVRVSLRKNWLAAATGFLSSPKASSQDSESLIEGNEWFDNPKVFGLGCHARSTASALAPRRNLGRRVYALRLGIRRRNLVQRYLVALAYHYPDRGRGHGLDHF